MSREDTAGKKKLRNKKNSIKRKDWRSLSFVYVGDQQYLPVSTLTRMLGMRTDIKILDFLNEKTKEEPIQLLSIATALHLCDYLGTRRTMVLKARINVFWLPTDFGQGIPNKADNQEREF